MMQVTILTVFLFCLFVNNNTRDIEDTANDIANSHNDAGIVEPIFSLNFGNNAHHSTKFGIMRKMTPTVAMVQINSKQK